MSFSDPTSHAAIDVSVNDRGVEAKLAEIEARLNATVNSLDRKEAVINIRGDAENLKLSIASAKREIDSLMAKEAEQAALASKMSNAEASRYRASTVADSQRRAQLQRDVALQQQLLQRTMERLAGEQQLSRELDLQAQRDSALKKAEQDIARARAEEDARQARVLSDRRQARLTDIKQTDDLLVLEQRLNAARANVDRLGAAAERAPASDKVRIQVDASRALLELDRVREEMRLRGLRPIEQRIEPKVTGMNRLFDSWTKLPAETQTKLDDIGAMFRRLGRVKINLGPFNASIAGVLVSLGTLAPAIAAVAGAAGSLVAVLGSGIAGAAGLGGAALTGFGLAAIGVKSALSGQMEQLSTFKTALEAYKTALLTYGPNGGLTPSQQRSAAAAQRAIPVDQQRVAVAQTRLDAINAQGGGGSVAAASAAATLASAQNTLTSAQQRATAQGNQTANALAKLNQIIAQSDPNMRAAEKNWLGLSKSWAALTHGTASRDFGSALNQIFVTARANLGWFAKDTNTALDTLSKGFGNWMKLLRTPDMQRALDNIFSNTNRSLGPLMDGIGHIASAMIQWFSTMSNYLPGFAQDFDDFAKAIDGSAKSTDGWANNSHTFIESLKSIAGLARAAGRYLLALFAPGVQPGNNFVDDMARSLNRTADAMRTIQGQKNLADFFQRSITGTKQLWQVLEPLAGVFIHLAALFAPLATAMIPILTFITNLASGITGLLGPMGNALVDLAAFVAVGKLLGLTRALGIVGQLQTAWGGVQKGIRAAKIAMGEFAAADGIFGRIKAGWQSLRDSFSKPIKQTLSQQFESGASTLYETLQKAFGEGATEIYNAIVRGSSVGATEQETGIATGGGIAAREEAVGAASGGALGGGGSILRGGERAAASDAAAIERTAASDVPPPVVFTREAGALEKGAGGVMSRLGGASMVGLGGVAVSQLAGSAIGGKTGSAVSNIGSLTSAGVGLGMMTGNPLIALAGGVGGALLGTVLTFVHLHARDLGKEFADRFMEPFHGVVDQSITDAYRKDIAKHINAAKDAASFTPTGMIPQQGKTADTPPIDKKQFNKWFNNLYQVGKDAAGEFISAFGSVQFKSVPAFVMDAQMTLKSLKGPAKQSAADTMLTYAAQLEQSGKLPKGAVQAVINGIQKVFPQLRTNLQKEGRGIGADWESYMKLQTARNGAVSTVESLRSTFGLLNIDPHVNGTTLLKNMGVAMDDLRLLMHDKSPQVRKAATDQFKQLQTDTSRILGAMVDDTDGKLGRLVTSIRDHIPGAVSGAMQDFQAFAKAVDKAMASGSMSTTQGTAAIAKVLNATLAALGSKTSLPAVTIQGYAGNPGALSEIVQSIAAGNQPNFSASPGGGTGHGFGAATGGRVPGAVGPDTWFLVDQNGQIGGKVGGAELLIANRHTEHRVDHMLSYFGTSLENEVFAENRPHTAPGYATGGRPSAKHAGYTDPLPGFHIGRTDMGVDANAPVGTPILALGPSIMTALVPDWYAHQPLMNFRLTGGPYAGRDWYVAEEINPLVHTGQRVAEGQPVATYASHGTGIEIGWSANDAGVTLAKATTGYTEGQVTPAGQSFRGLITGGGFAAPMAVGPTIPTIPAPTVGGRGPVSAMVRKGLGTVTNAANAYLRAQAPSVSVPAGMGAGSPAQARAWTEAGMRLAGVSGGAWESMLLRQENRESSFRVNPPNINDINTQRGDPSRGILQITGSNFAQYKIPGHNNILNPVDNIAAAIRYIIGTYSRGGGPSHALSWMIANGGNAYATGGRVGGPLASIARKKGKHTSKGAKTHKMGKTQLDESLTDVQLEAVYQQKVQAALQAYQTYNNTLHHKHPHMTGTLGHFTGKAGYSDPKTGLFIPSTLKWHKSTQHSVGGITAPERAHLQGLLSRVQTLRAEDPHWISDAAAARAVSTVQDIPAKDRIGGIGTQDIDDAMNAARTEWQDAQYTVEHMSKKDKKYKGAVTKADDLHHIFTGLQKLDRTAATDIQQFDDMTAVIGNLGAYMDLAGGTASDSWTGADPGTGATPNLGGPMRNHTWAKWKQIREYWQHKHTAKLQAARADLERIFGGKKHKVKNKYALQYIQQLTGDIAADQQAQQALDATTDTGGVVPGTGPGGGTAGGVSYADMTTDAFIESLGNINNEKDLASDFATVFGTKPPKNEKYTDYLARLNYQYSLDQGKVVSDSPGTPQREDLLSQIPETTDARAMMDFYNNVLTRMQADPHVGLKSKTPNYPLLTSASDAYNAARSTYMGLQQQQTDAATQSGPSQVALLDTARANMFASYASNVAPVSGAPMSGAATGAAAASAMSPMNPATMSSPTPVTTDSGGRGTTVHVTNNYQTQPSDPHTWSQALSWELQAAI